MNYIEKGVKLKLNFRSGSAFASNKAREYLSMVRLSDIKIIITSNSLDNSYAK